MPEPALKRQLSSTATVPGDPHYRFGTVQKCLHVRVREIGDSDSSPGTVEGGEWWS